MINGNSNINKSKKKRFLGGLPLVTFNVNDSDTLAPIEGATISINSQTLTTDINGQATIELENGTYSYEITKSGFSTVTGSVVVNDADVTVDEHLVDQSAFIFTIDTTKGDGDNTFTLPLRLGFNYDFEVDDWGDGNSDTITAYNQAEITHTYASGGVYQVKIKGLCEAWYFNNGGDKDKLISIEQFGATGWKSMESAFYGCSNLLSGGGSSDFGQVTDMVAMFFSCTSLSTLDVSLWNVGQVTSMAVMFYNCTSLSTLDVGSWNVENVTSMRSMFNRCTSLSTLDVGSWNVSQVKDMFFMFYGCSSLSTLDVASWNVGQVTNTSQMFNSCNSLLFLDVASWDVGQVTNMFGMFFACSSLSTLDVASWNVGQVTDMGFMFTNCTSLSVINWFNFASEVGSLGVDNTALQQTYVDELFFKLEAYYQATPPTKALSVNTSGGTADAPSPTGQGYISDLETIFTDAVQILTITTN